MIKEFKIDDILDAVDALEKLNKKQKKINSEKKPIINDNPENLSNQAKMNKSEILVLDQMIE